MIVLKVFGALMLAGLVGLTLGVLGGTLGAVFAAFFGARVTLAWVLG